MQCGKCKFSVPSNMRFCLMKNMCPSCGSPLFSESDMNHLSMLQNRINTKGFAKEMDQVQVYDLALFIYGEIKNGYGRTILDEEVKKLTTNSSPPSEPEVPYNHEDDAPEAQSAPDDVTAIKLEVEEELREQIKANLELDNAVEMGNIYDDDEDDKIARLKAQAKKHNKRKTGASVRRLS